MLAIFDSDIGCYVKALCREADPSEVQTWLFSIGNCRI